MKATKITLAGTDYFLVFNGAAMFEFEEAFGGTGQFMDRIKAGGRDSFSAVCQAAAILAQQGELARRALGYDGGPMLEEEKVRALATPMEAAELQRAVVNTIIAGYKRDIPSEEAEDLGLLELEQKKTKR